MEGSSKGHNTLMLKFGGDGKVPLLYTIDVYRYINFQVYIWLLVQISDQIWFMLILYTVSKGVQFFTPQLV